MPSSKFAGGIPDEMRGVRWSRFFLEDSHDCLIAVAIEMRACGLLP